MAQLMMHKDVLKNFHKLPTKVQKKVADFIERFKNNPADPALHLHKLDAVMADKKVRGANLPDGYRAIIISPERGETYLMVHINAHDKAYAWAKNKQFEMHPKTGVFQIFDTGRVRAAVDQQAALDTPPDDYPLAKLTDDELFRAGVPEPLIPAIRAISDDEALLALSDYLPKDCNDVLVGIAAGMSLNQALEEMLGMAVSGAGDQAPENTGDFTHLAQGANVDLVLVEGEEHLKDILAASLEEWRIFLHPYQKKLVQWQTNGPMHISGSAGTGKTVCLLHRAVHLARNLTAKGKEKVLLTTFTINLSITLKAYIKKLDPVAAERIEVTNLNYLARTICNRSGWTGRIGDKEDFTAIWEEIWDSGKFNLLPMSQKEMEEEYRQVIDVNGIDTEEDYLTTVRSGRKRISRKQRRQAWPVFRAFQRGLKKRNILTSQGAVHQARLAVEQGNFETYRHVLVDEAQDFGLEALKLIRALSPIDEGLSDPLCTAGDGHQRIYLPRIPISRAGIEIRGRSRRLKINYRTSEQIRTYAQAMLMGLEIDDLDGGNISTAGDHSAFKGPEPVIETCPDEQTEARIIVAWAARLMDKAGLKSHEVCITPYKPAIVTALTDALIPILRLKARETDPGRDEPGIRLGSIRRIKGLEFRAVALACADPADAMNHLSQADILQRCERYVAATRAREQLLVTLGGGDLQAATGSKLSGQFSTVSERCNKKPGLGGHPN